MKIIHIVENLNKGAVENWLVNVFVESRKIRPDWKWTFYCILGEEGKLDNKVREAGGEIIYAPVTISNKLKFLKYLRLTLVKGKYDIIHSHHDYLSGFYLTAAAGLSFQKRILQIHNTDKGVPVGNPLLQKALLSPLKRIGILSSDVVLGISETVLEEFAGITWRKNKKYRLLYYGIDMSRFEKSAHPDDFRRSLNILPESKIILFVGRLNDLKNPVYLVDIISHLLKVRKNVYAVFVGDGDQRDVIVRKSTKLGVSDHIKIIGWSDDIAEIMKCSDAFVFPRKQYPKEGLGLVVVEAQASGLPMFITDGIVKDAIVIKELAFYNNLTDASVWAKQIEDVLDSSPIVSQDCALSMMKASNFDLNTATSNLVNIYEERHDR